MAATTLVFDSKVAPFLPLASSAHPGFGWTDASGSIWSTNATSDLTALGTSVSPASLLGRPGTGAGTSALTPGTQENSLNQRVKLTCTIPSITVSNGPVIILRWNGLSGATTLNGYLFLFSPSTGQIKGYHTVLGVSTLFYTSATVTFVAGNSYTLDVEATQTNGTTTTFAITLLNNTASSSLITAFATTDPTTQLQNPAASGFAIDATGNGFAQVVTKVQYFTDMVVNAVASATSYGVTLATGGVTGLAQTGTIAVAGGIALTSTLSVALADTLGGTFSPNPVTITSGQGSAAFTYTPATAGADTVSWSFTGGNAGMTGNGSQVDTITAPIALSNPNLFLSDNWWISGGAAYTQNAGAYLKLAHTGSTLKLLIDVTNLRTSAVTAAEWPVIRYSVDGGIPVDLLLADPGTNLLTLDLSAALTGAATHTLKLVIRTVTQLFNRWTVNASGVPPAGLRLTGIVLAAGGATASLAGTVLAVLPMRLRVFGDSTGEGSKTSFPAAATYTDAEAAWPHVVASALGAELSNEALSGQAYFGQLGVPDVPHFGSAWNLRFAGQSKLAAGAFISNSGASHTDLTIINMSTNDAANAAAKTAGTIKPTLTAIKAADPATIMVLLLPFAFHQPYFSAQGWAAFLLSEYAAYMATDPTALLLDLGAAAGTGLDSYPASSPSNPYSVDRLHPGGPRSLVLGAKITALLQAALTVPRPAQVVYA